MLMFSSFNPKFFAVRHIYYPVNPSSDHFHTDAVVPSSDHYCVDTVAPSGDRDCIDIVGTSSDHYGSTKVAPPTEHLHTKRTQQGKLIGENSPKVGGGHVPVAPSGYDEEGESDDWTGKSHFSSHGRRSISPAVDLPITSLMRPHMNYPDCMIWSAIVPDL